MSNMNFKLILPIYLGIFLVYIPDAFCHGEYSGPEPYSFEKTPADLSLLNTKPVLPFFSEIERKKHAMRRKRGPG